MGAVTSTMPKPSPNYVAASQRLALFSLGLLSLGFDVQLVTSLLARAAKHHFSSRSWYCVLKLQSVDTLGAAAKSAVGREGQSD